MAAMTPERWQRVNELFEAALKRNPDQRARFLNEACAGDDELRSQVVSLLAHHEQADAEAFLDEPRSDPAQGQPLQRRRFPIRLNCPHCRNPIAIVDDSPEEEVVCPSCGSSFRLDEEKIVSWSPDKLPKLEKFELLEPVGRGAFGTVYRAHDTELDRIVAVKVPRSGSFATQEDEDRFVREARSVAQLKHPGIVPVYEVGRSEAFPYIVTEYIHGRTLSDHLTGDQLSFREAAQLVAEIAEALADAHQKGVVHRDLKPSNIMLERIEAGASETARETTTSGPASTRDTRTLRSTSRGDSRRFRPRLMDFGLALREEGEITVTIDGQVLGTPAYMSPEQARGEGHHVDGRSDVYSLGVILYELLAGELPFRGNARMLIDQVINDEPRSPRKLNDHLPRDLETICLKCLEKEAERRYQSAAEVAADLRRWLGGEPIQARPIGRAARGWRWCRRHPAVASLSAAVSLLLLTVAIGSSVAALRIDQERRVAERNNELATEQGKRANELARTAIDQATALELNLYYKDIALAERELASGNVERVEALLAGCPQALQGWEWRYLKQQCGEQTPFVVKHAQGVWDVAFSPDGSRLCTASIDGTVKVLNVENRQEERTFYGANLLGLDIRLPIMCAAFSRDGTQIASTDMMINIKIWNVKNKKVVHNLQGHTNPVIDVEFSPDGRRLASAGWDSTVRVWDTKTGQQVLHLDDHSHMVNSVTFSPDGTKLASGSFDETIKIWDASSGTVLATLRGHRGAVRDLAFSPEGDQLASASLDGTLRVWKTDTGEELFNLRGHTGPVLAVAYSPDGKRLVSGGYNATIKIWDPATGQAILTLRGHKDNIWTVTFDNEGRRLASASFDSTVKIWDATPSKETTERDLPGFEGHEWWLNDVAFSPDGGRLASASWDNSARIWDVETGEQLLKLDGHTGSVWSVAFSPDGRTLASASWDKTVKIWNATTGEEIRTLRGHEHLLHRAVYSRDGRQIASAGWNGRIMLWNAATGREEGTLSHSLGPFPVHCLAFGPRGQKLASGGGDTSIVIWDLTTHKKIHSLSGHTSAVYHVDFSPDGQQIVSASWDSTLKLWDVTTGQLMKTLTGHTNRTNVAIFSPDGLRIASASDDMTVRIWDPVTGRETAPPRRHKGIIWGLAYSPDGKLLASGSLYLKRGLRVWPAPDGE